MSKVAQIVQFSKALALVESLVAQGLLPRARLILLEQLANEHSIDVRFLDFAFEMLSIKQDEDSSTLELEHPDSWQSSNDDSDWVASGCSWNDEEPEWTDSGCEN